MEKHAEILAPAGGEAQLRAAVLCGADAVYLGLRGFNARAGAENFDENTLPQTVGWCHARGVRVYVTLNTLVTDRELPQWLHSLDAVAAAGVDGVLVQDLGVLSLIAREFPHLCVHASTQMALHNAAGARLARSLGMRRVVLAREMSLEEIAELRAKTPRFFLSIRRAKRGVCFSFFQFFFISACMCTGRLRCIRYTTSHAAFSACAPRHSVRDTAARAANVPCRRTR